METTTCKCLACNSAVEDDLYYILLEKYPDYLLCDECYRMLKLLPNCTCEETYNKIDILFSRVVRNKAIPESIRVIFRNADEAYWARKESTRSYEDAQAEAIEALILTTGGTIDGYKVVKYLDIISCEVVFKNSLVNSLTAGIEDFFRSLSVKEQEMAGAMELIDRAKVYVMKKFREKAVSIGANAVLGIDFETTFASDIVKISVNGTAVAVDPVED